MNKEWNELHKSFQALISKEDTFEQGKLKLLELRKNIFDMISLVRGGFNPNGYSLMPFPRSRGYASTTMAYCLYHVARVEDFVCHTLLKNDEQIYDKGNYRNRLNISIKTTGEELIGEEIVNFSRRIELIELFNYLNEVYLETNDFITNLKFTDLKTKVTYNSDCVSIDDTAGSINEKRCNYNTSYYLKTAFSRHWIMHTDAFLKIKNQIVKQARKQTKIRFQSVVFPAIIAF